MSVAAPSRSLIRVAAAGLLATVAMIAPPRPVASAPFFDELRAAREAMARGDLDAARRDFARLDSLAGGLPSTTYNLAQIAARAGRREEALGRLRRYADMGLWRPAARDTAFTSLAGDPAFAAVSADFEKNLRPIERATVVARLEDASLLAEDLAFDPTSRVFYVSSIHRGKVVAVDSSGTARDFAVAEPGWGVYALAIDGTRRILWGSVAASPTTAGFAEADSGRAGLVAWALATGERRARVDLPDDGKARLIGDMTLGTDGVLYATDSMAGALYRLRPGASSLETLAKPGTFGSPQMPVLIETGRRLWLSDYPRGLVEFDLKRRLVRAVPKPADAALAGIDGLARASRDRLIAVQNGTQPIRVIELSLNATHTAVTGVRVLERASALMAEPTHVIVVGRDAYVLGNSGWDRVNREGEMETPEGAVGPAILRLPLDEAP